MCIVSYAGHSHNSNVRMTLEGSKIECVGRALAGVEEGACVIRLYVLGKLSEEQYISFWKKEQYKRMT